MEPDTVRLVGKQIHGVEVVSNLDNYYISGEEVFIVLSGGFEIKRKKYVAICIR